MKPFMARHLRREADPQHGGERGGGGVGWRGSLSRLVSAIAPTLVGVTQANQKGWGWVASWVWWGGG